MMGAAWYALAADAGFPRLKNALSAKTIRLEKMTDGGVCSSVPLSSITACKLRAGQRIWMVLKILVPIILVPGF
jgi:hypothetical protein